MVCLGHVGKRLTADMCQEDHSCYSPLASPPAAVGGQQPAGGGSALLWFHRAGAHGAGLTSLLPVMVGATLVAGGAGSL